MKVSVKIKLTPPNLLGLITILACIVLGARICVNVISVGDDAENNTININYSETTIVTLSTDETTVISEQIN